MSKNENIEDTPVFSFPFTLDNFQKEAIMHLKNNENILVTAHTSAGKTAIAKYAIALALKNQTRVIYTSPIKALSNQKYNDFDNTFKNKIGLMTGDISKNTEANCLVMTTEILRNMLYRSSETLSKTTFVIFDEVHYMKDSDRGVVWEESIILLDKCINLIFLSATLSNAHLFVKWIQFLKNRKCFHISTATRPVPLKHYIFPKGGNYIYELKKGDGDFQINNFNRTLSVFNSNNKTGDKSILKNQREKKSYKPCNRVIDLLIKENNQPIIIFSFIRRETEKRAIELFNNNYNSPEEAKLVTTIFNNAINSLKEEDKNIPQIRFLLPLLKKGIGVHHSGLLLILKETIEILFEESLIKVLFATETFAMGINMPAKTVVFSSYQKYDGRTHRNLSSGEYIQMSGRAGRRGKDKIGICVLIADEKLTIEVCKSLINGKPDPITSSFNISFAMVLNLLNNDLIQPEKIIEMSFYQFQCNHPEIEEKESVEDMKKEITQINHNENANNFCRLNIKLDKLNEKYYSLINQPEIIIPFLQPGRVVYINVKNEFGNNMDKDNKLKLSVGDWGWGILIGIYKKHEPFTFFVDVLVKCEKVFKSGKMLIPIVTEKKNDEDKFCIIRVKVSCITKISTIRIYLPREINKLEVMKNLYDKVRFSKILYKEIPILNILESTNFKSQNVLNKEIHGTIKQIENVKEKIKDKKFDVFNDLKKEKKKEMIESFRKVKKINKNINKYESTYNTQEKIKLFREELKNHVLALKKLNYVSEDGVVLLKGRVACYIESADTLILTELIFDGNFNNLSPAECVSILSVLINHEKSKGVYKKPPKKLKVLYNKVLDTALRVIQVKNECNFKINEREFLHNLEDNMISVCYHWCMGYKFIDICKMTDLFEGSIIRLIRRIHELLLQLVDAVKNIGNDELVKKFEDCIVAVKRGIAFAASLYLD